MPDPAPKPPYNMALGSSSTVTSERDHEHGLQHRRPPASGIRATIARAALHTSPAFFSVTMGTGISSILLYNFPYPARWLEYLGIIAFVLNVVIFTVLLALTMARFILFRGLWTQLLHHNVASMFWGTFPMGFVTIINMISLVCVKAWGKHWARLALGLWWIDIVVAVTVSLGMLFIMFTRQQHTNTTLAPTWLLPIVAPVVASATGSVVANALIPFNPHLARATLLASYAVWGLGVPLAFMVIALVIYRFALGGPPETQQITSVFLPLGPCGQGAFGIINMGVVARKLAYSGTSIVPNVVGDEALRIADTMYAGGLVAGLVLWGLALAWYTLAMAMFIDRVSKHRSVLGRDFTNGLWALTFPVGTFATASLSLGQEFHSTAFRVIASFLSVQVVLSWLYVLVFTAIKAAGGKLEALEVVEGEAVAKRWDREDKV